MSNVMVGFVVSYEGLMGVLPPEGGIELPILQAKSRGGIWSTDYQLPRQLGEGKETDLLPKAERD